MLRLRYINLKSQYYVYYSNPIIFRHRLNVRFQEIHDMHFDDLIVFVHESKQKKYKYDALIQVSKNVKDSEEIRDLLNSFKDSKKSNKDLRRTGLVTLFTGIGLAALGKFGLNIDVLFGVGLLVMFIGLGQMIAGYVYPNQPDEISDVVESYEKK